MKVLVKMARSGALCYISHLDLLRCVQRTMRRANIPMQYSKGFNPHPILSFAQAMGVGLATKGDYFMVELYEAMPPPMLTERFNKKAPEGLCALRVREAAEDEKSPMALVQAATYRLQTDAAKLPLLHKGVAKLMAMPAFIYTIRDRQEDLRKLIFNAVCDADGALCCVSCGNENLPHKSLAQAVCELAGLEIGEISLWREELLTKNEEGELLPLFDMFKIRTVGE